MRVNNNGDIYEADDTVGILMQMWDDNFHKDDFDKLEDYMKWMTEQVWIMFRVGLEIRGEFIEGKADNFIKDLADKEIIHIEE